MPRPKNSRAEGTAQATFREWMDELGHEMSEVAMVGWIVADAAYQGQVDAGPDFDQQKVIDATNQITDFTADGLVPPIDWSTAHIPPTPDDRITNGTEQQCAAMVRVNESAAFEIYGGSPEEPWICFPTWVFILFGFAAINFARHPQGILEYQLHRRAVKAAERRERREATPPGTVRPPTPEPRIGPRSESDEPAAARHPGQ